MSENKDMITRLACCVVVALIICYGLEHFSGALHLQVLEQYRPWLEENKIQAVAVVAAVLFGLSLVAFPLPEKCEPEMVPPSHSEC